MAKTCQRLYKCNCAVVGFINKFVQIIYVCEGDFVGLTDREQQRTKETAQTGAS
jgi:hypothetical protein